MKARFFCLLAVVLLATNSFGQVENAQPSRTRPGRRATHRPPTPLPRPKDPKATGTRHSDRSPTVYSNSRMPGRENPQRVRLPPRFPGDLRPLPMPGREARPSRVFRPSPLSPQDEFAATYNEIKWTRPAVAERALECDKDVIRTTLPGIKKVYAENGLTEEKAEEVALVAWKEVRLASPLQPYKCMVSASYTAFTLSLGTLVFKTNPGDANIAIDGKSMPAKTLHQRLFEAGIKRKVRFSKPGYAPAEVVCTAVERISIECYAELKPLP